MSQPFMIAASDTLPALAVQCVDSKGAVVDLTSATVTFGMKDVPGGTAVSLTGSVSVTDAANGKCAFEWTTADTATVGNYVGQFKVVLPSSAGTERFPNDGSLIPIKITATAV